MSSAALKSTEARQTEVLQRLDNAKFSWYHLRAILISGAGFYTDAYDLFIISLVTPMLGAVYYPQDNGKLPRTSDLWLKGTALAGTLCGQLLFGVLGDAMGRKKVYLYTLLLMIFCTVAQALSASTISGLGVVAVMCFWRYCLGIGIGGDYPLSAVITSEYATNKTRGAMIAAVFSMQGFGMLSAAATACICLAAFQSSIENNVDKLDTVWRLLIGLGAVPAALTIYLRARLPETPRYTMQVNKNVKTAEHNVNAIQSTGHAKFKDEVEDEDADRITWASFKSYLSANRRNSMVLFGTCSTWFFLDIAYYAQNLFMPNILSDLGWAPAMNINDPSSVYDRMFSMAKGQAIITLMGTFPGYFFTIAFVEKMGRVTIQYMGFIMMTVLLAIMAGCYNLLRANSHWAFVILYALTFFFANFGPNTTTFIIPAEVYPTSKIISWVGMVGSRVNCPCGLWCQHPASLHPATPHSSSPPASSVLKSIAPPATACLLLVARRAPSWVPLASASWPTAKAHRTL
jgi:PHS family inorganic phosphate transporter-like MFS transporter